MTDFHYDDDDCICPADGRDHRPDCPYSDLGLWDDDEDGVGMVVRVPFEQPQYRALCAMMRAHGEDNPNRFIRDMMLRAIEEWQAVPPHSAVAEAD